MTSGEMYQIAAAFVGQIIVLIGVVWGVVSWKFNSLETSFRDNLLAGQKIFDRDVSSIRQQLVDMRIDINRELDDVKRGVAMSVTMVQCQSRMEQENRILGMLEKTLDSILQKIESLNKMLLDRGDA